MKARLAVACTTVLVMALGVVFGASVASAASPRSSSSGSPKAAAASGGSWIRYHYDDGHTGFDPSQPNAAGATAGWVSPVLDESVYGEPLVYNGLVYVATSNNTVYALNQGTGAVVWSHHLGAPQTGGWLCGNVNPTGILGTGVIDVAQSRIYEVAFLNQYLSYFLFGLDLATGAQQLLSQVSPNTFNWKIQQQRGALNLSTDGTHVYIPFGGRAGDCGPYHSWIVGVPTAGVNPQLDELWQGPDTGAGSWAAGGIVVDDSTGHVFFSQGNAIPCSSAQFSDSVIETNSSLGGLSYFQPADWQSHWCVPDSDLGSTSPVLISPSLMFMAGKYGQGFLLNPAALGGTGGQLFPAQSPYTGADVCAGTNSDATFGSFAYAAPRVYLECEGRGIVSLTVNPAAPSFSTCDSSCTAAGTWHAGDGTTYGPPIVAGGAVWAVDINGGGLVGFDAATGNVLYQSSGFGVTHFTTPSEAGGRIFVSADTVVRSFNMVAGCSTMSASAAPPTTASVGTQVVVTGAASGVGSGCPNPRYEFWLLPPGGTWGLARGYTSTATYNWDTTGLAPGVWRFSVWARDAASGNSYDSFSAFNYQLTTTVCTGMTATPSPATSAEVGTPVSVTGSATGCPNPRYEFWLLPPGGSWSLVQPYSATATFIWSTAGRVPGVWRFSVWARDASSSASYDAFSAFNYTLTTCSGMTATASPANGTSIGTPVIVTGTASGCSSPQYEFWLKSAAGTWSLVRGYSANNQFNWTTSGMPAGTYRFSVWARDLNSPNSYDVFSAFDYVVSVVPCTGMTASAVPAGSASRGTTVTVTGSATGCPNPQYEFWLKLPNGTWALARGWSGVATFSWSTSAGMAAGTYRFSVWARDLSSAASYDAFSAFDYTLN